MLLRRGGVEWLSSSGNIRAMDVDGSNLHALTTDFVDGWPNPLADGRIAFATRRDGNEGIYVMNGDPSRTPPSGSARPMNPPLLFKFPTN